MSDYPNQGKPMDVRDHPSRSVPQATHHYWGDSGSGPLPTSTYGATTAGYTDSFPRATGTVQFNLEGNFTSR